MSEEGGTRIQRSRQGPPAPQQMMQQNYEQQNFQQPNFQQPNFQQQVPQQQVAQQVPRSILKKSSFGSKIDFDSPSFKYSIIVAVLFLLLNSKIIWNQIIKFPFMGSMEPSMIALVVNSILAGIVFYIIINFI